MHPYQHEGHSGYAGYQGQSPQPVDYQLHSAPNQPRYRQVGEIVECWHHPAEESQHEFAPPQNIDQDAHGYFYAGDPSYLLPSHHSNVHGGMDEVTPFQTPFQNEDEYTGVQSTASTKINYRKIDLDNLPHATTYDLIVLESRKDWSPESDVLLEQSYARLARRQAKEVLTFRLRQVYSAVRLGIDADGYFNNWSDGTSSDMTSTDKEDAHLDFVSSTENIQNFHLASSKVDKIGEKFRGRLPETYFAEWSDPKKTPVQRNFGSVGATVMRKMSQLSLKKSFKSRDQQHHRRPSKKIDPSKLEDQVDDLREEMKYANQNLGIDFLYPINDDET